MISNHRRRFGLVLINFATLSFAVASVGFWLSYRQQVKETKRILESVNSHSSTLIATLKNNFDQKKTLDILNTYHQNPSRFQTEEIIIGKKSGETIDCIYSRRQGHPSCDLTFEHSLTNQDWAKPMKLALEGQKGSEILKDYRGKKVIAAYSPVAPYSWGVVHKVDLSEIQAHFLRGWWMVAIGSFLINGVGIFLFFRFTSRNLLTSEEVASYKQLQEKLNQDKDFITAVINNTNTLTVVVDSERRIIAINLPCQELFGITLEAVQGKTFAEVFIPQFNADFSVSMITDYHDFSQIYLTNESDLKSPTKYIVEWQEIPFINSNNKINCYIFNGIEITEKYIYEKSLYASESRFKAMFDKAAIAILEIDGNRQIIKANRTAETLFHHPRDEMVGHFLDEYVSPMDLDKELHFFGELVTNSRNYYQMDIQYISQNKLSFWGQSIFSGIFDNNNQFDYAIVMIQDISSQRNAEREKIKLAEKNKNLVKALGEIVYSYNIVEDVIEWQGGVESILGYTPGEMGTSTEQWLTLIHSEDRASIENELNLIKDNHTNFFEKEYRLLAKSGQFIWVLDRGVTIFDQDNTLLKIEGILADITVRKEAEESLRKTNAELILSLNKLADYNQDILKINELNEYLQTCHRTQEIYEVVPHFLKMLFPDCNGAIFKIDQKNQLVTSILGWGETLSEELFSVTDCWSLRQNQVTSYPNTTHRPHCSHLDSNVMASLCIPLVSMEKGRGLLVITSAKDTNFTENKKQIAIALAENISLALSNLELREILEFQSIRDSLTGLYNRHYWEEFLNREIDYVQRSQRPLGIIMLDLDYFKQFNDNNGHGAGDELLIEVARLFQDTIRKTDIACRYGGEEFLIILPDTSLQMATEIAERIRVKISEVCLHSQGKALSSITASFGVTCCTSAEAKCELLARADAALYQAKHEGRDRIVKV
ncbi:diguanylate cyclase [Synechocystis sp. LEGE 06083]|uniref:diguanylate cyclase n=1 Tax=Synechocystis sp. LEGE 06083 TaxID=915336 RepID=UPI0018817D8D|nr:diguanylate cyclase [Synechocystis sp. LEGE 06083]MBE9194970.1 diguanylate cyclase [Synechocystis sp. LEGE 06083]